MTKTLKTFLCFCHMWKLSIRKSICSSLYKLMSKNTAEHLGTFWTFSGLYSIKNGHFFCIPWILDTSLHWNIIPQVLLGARMHWLMLLPSLNIYSSVQRPKWMPCHNVAIALCTYLETYTIKYVQGVTIRWTSKKESKWNYHFHIWQIIHWLCLWL